MHTKKVHSFEISTKQTKMIKENLLANDLYNGSELGLVDKVNVYNEGVGSKREIIY